MTTKQKIRMFTLILIGIIGMSIYLIIFHAYHSYGTWLAALCIALLFISLLILQFLWIDVAKNSFWSYNMRTLAVIVLMIPIVYGLTKAENSYENASLQKYGVETATTITYTNKTSGNNVVAYHGVYQYTVNGQTYTHKLTNNQNIYTVGDTVRIVYSARNPNMDKVILYKAKAFGR